MFWIHNYSKLLDFFSSRCLINFKLLRREEHFSIAPNPAAREPMIIAFLDGFVKQNVAALSFCSQVILD